MLPTLAPATPSPNVAFVNAAFEVVLHRPADPSAAQFVTLLNAGGMTQTQLVQTLVNSAEFRTAEVNALDQNFLKHGADAAGLNAFLGMLGSGTAAQVAAVIAASPEYYRAAGSTNTGFLEKLFLDGLGRPLDAASQTAFLLQLRQGASRTQVATAVLQSAEGASRLLLVLYQTAMQRSGTPNGSTLVLAALAAIQQSLLALPATVRSTILR